MNNEEWWTAVRKAAEHWHKVAVNLPGVLGNAAPGDGPAGRADEAKPMPEGSGDKGGKRKA